MAPTGFLATGLALALLPAGMAPGDEPTPAGAAAPSPAIVIEVSGLRSDEGRLSCGLFVEDNWLRAGVASP